MRTVVVSAGTADGVDRGVNVGTAAERGAKSGTVEDGCAPADPTRASAGRTTAATSAVAANADGRRRWDPREWLLLPV